MGMSMKHAILGLLDLSAFTGYDLKKAFDQTVNHFWSGDQAQIYRTLAVLVAEGLARVEVVPHEGRPSRKVHHITDLGRAELDRWLVAATEPVPERSEFLAKLFFSPRLQGNGVLELLLSRREAVEDHLGSLLQLADENRERSGRPDRIRFATLEYGLAHTRAELVWLDELMEEMS